MNSAMKQSVLIAYRTGSSIPQIAKALGFPEQQVSKVVHPPSTCRITTAFKSVNIGGKKLIPMAEMKEKVLSKKEIQMAAGRKAANTRKANQLKKLEKAKPDPYLLITDALSKISEALLILKKGGA